MRSFASAFLGALMLAPPALAQGDPEAGRALAEANCARCHAVEAEGDSPDPEARPFREFASMWPLEALEESLAEGIVVGHPDMPEFRFEPDAIADLIAHLDAIAEP